MSGQNRIISAQLAKPKTPKGSALKSALSSAFAANKIAKVTGQEKQGKSSNKK